MSGTLALASAIAGMDRHALESLVSRRRPQTPAGIHDPIGLASELLRPESIARALAPLDRVALAALLARDESSPAFPALQGLGLVGSDGPRAAPLPEVEATLRSALGDEGVRALAEEPREIPAAALPDAAPATEAWYAAATTAVGEFAECLRVLREHPGRVNRSGAVAVATVRFLAEAASIEQDHAALAVTALERARLVSVVDQNLVVSARADGWLRLAPSARWIAVARATVDAMPEPLAVSLAARGGSLSDAVADLPRRFPLLSGLERAEAFAARAEHLGLTVQSWLSPPAVPLLAGDAEAALAVAEHEMPETAPGIYVQPDLSVVVPGPLAPQDEAELAALTRPEHIGVASTRRITEASLSDALERGATAQSAREVFERLSLTGIPQPLDYLLGTLEDRLRRIVVTGYDGDENRTLVRVARPELAAPLLADRALQHLQLHRGEDPTVLFSRLRPEHVFAALTDARHPATRTAPPASPPRLAADVPPAARERPERAAIPSEIAELVDRVYGAARAEPDTADFSRRLELAIRERALVRVTAEARGEQRTFTLLPVSLSGGRLRAADQAADVERTFPVSMITSVEPV